MTQKTTKWVAIRKRLSCLSERDLLGLLSDLYTLSKANQNFFEARFLQETESLDRYKTHIQRHLAPREPSQKISILEAKKAISDYKKASSNPIHLIDLMIYYVECGTAFTCEFGDMDETYYGTLESMFEKAILLMKKQPRDEIEDFIHRLEVVVGKTRSIGWGYHDFIADILRKAYGSESTS